MDIVIVDAIIKEAALKGITVEQRRIFPKRIIDVRKLLKDGPSSHLDKEDNKESCTYVLRISDQSVAEFLDTVVQTARDSCVEYMMNKKMKKVYINAVMKRDNNNKETHVYINYQETPHSHSDVLDH